MRSREFYQAVIDAAYAERNMLRATIQGDLGGYPIVFYLYDDDLNQANEDGVAAFPDLENIEIGRFQWTVGELQSHDILPPFKSKSASVAAPADPNNWKCPEHGDEFVRANSDSRFPWKHQCQKYSSSKENWTSDKASNVRGDYRYYCKYKNQ